MADDVKGAFHQEKRKAMTLAERRRAREKIDPNEVLGALTQGDGSRRPVAVEPQAESVTEYVEVIPERALVPMDGKQIEAKGFVLTTTGLLMHDDATEEDWHRLGESLAHLHQSMQWLIGDWLNVGATVYGQSVEDAAERIGRERKTLYNWAEVARSVHFSRRRELLSFSHHAEVAPLEPDDQERLLALAEENEWTRAKLREEIHGKRQNAMTVIDRVADRAARARQGLARDVKKALNGTHAQRQQAADILDQHIEEVARLRDALRE